MPFVVLLFILSEKVLRIKNHFVNLKDRVMLYLRRRWTREQRFMKQLWHTGQLWVVWLVAFLLRLWVWTACKVQLA